MIIGISGKIGSGKDTVAKIINWLIWKERYHKFDESVVFSEQWYPKSSDAGTYEVKRFAGKLKKITAILTGCKESDLDDQNFKLKELPKEWWTYKRGVHGKGEFKFEHAPARHLKPEEFALADEHGRIRKPTYRWLLQVIGADMFRTIIGEDVWVNALFADYKGTPRNMRLVGDPMEDFPNWIITDVRFPNEADAIKERGGKLIRLERVMETYSDHPSETSLDNYLKFDYTIFNNRTIDSLVHNVKQILIDEKIL